MPTVGSPWPHIRVTISPFQTPMPIALAMAKGDLNAVPEAPTHAILNSMPQPREFHRRPNDIHEEVNFC